MFCLVPAPRPVAIHAVAVEVLSVFAMTEVVFGWHLRGEAAEGCVKREREPAGETIIVCMHFAHTEQDPC